MGKSTYKEKGVLIVNQDAGYLTADVANMFAEKYEHVVLFTGFLRMGDRPLHQRVTVERSIKYKRNSLLLRIWTWTLFTIVLFFRLMFKYRHYKVVYYSNPPFSLWLGLLFPRPFMVVVFDIYPHALKKIGFTEKSFLFRIWAFLNKKSYKKAVKVITLTQRMRSVLSEMVEGEKLVPIPLWSSFESSEPNSEINLFLEKYNDLKGKHIILYSGNMGLGHDLEPLMDVAYLMREAEDMVFVFAGNGIKKSILQRLAEEKELRNTLFLPAQPSNIFKDMLHASFVCVVATDELNSNLSIPSKTFNYLFIGKPILGLGPVDSELNDLLTQTQSGQCFEGKSVEQIYEFLYNLKHNNAQTPIQSDSLHALHKKYNSSNAKAYLF